MTTTEFEFNGLPTSFYGKCITALESMHFGNRILIDDNNKPAPKDRSLDDRYTVSGPAWFFYVHLFRFLNPELTPDQMEDVLLDNEGQQHVCDDEIQSVIESAKEVIRFLLR